MIKELNLYDIIKYKSISLVSNFPRYLSYTYLQPNNLKIIYPIKKIENSNTNYKLNKQNKIKYFQRGRYLFKTTCS